MVYLNQFLNVMVLNYSNNEKAEIKESQLREESAACHLLFILSTIAEGRDLNHMSARARAGGEARQLRLWQGRSRSQRDPPWLSVSYSLVCHGPCCHFYQIRRLHESCCLLEFLSGPLNAPDGEKYKYNRTTFRTKRRLSFLEIITFMSFSFDIFLRLKKRDKENEKLYF